MKARYMMATTAVHKLGDISRDTPDLCIVGDETETGYIGNWVAGFGFCEVRFPKSTTRELTPKEVEYYNKRYVRVSDGPAIKLDVAPEQSVFSAKGEE